MPDPNAQFHERVLSQAGQLDVRSALGPHRWLCHITEMRHLASVRLDGLLPSSIEVADGANEDVRKLLGGVAKPILCLNPLGSRIVQVPKGRPLMRLAISSNEFPSLIGVDWSFAGQFYRPQIILYDMPDATDEYILRRLFNDGSVAAYDAAHPTLIRVLTRHADPNDPATWPALVAVSDTDVAPCDEYGNLVPN